MKEEETRGEGEPGERRGDVSVPEREGERGVMNGRGRKEERGEGRDAEETKVGWE